MRFGTVSVVGRTNVGKSTFLNRVLAEDLAIVSALPGTTRDVLLGVLTHDNVQIAFLDTPGLQEPKSELTRRTNATALDASREADLALVVTALPGRRGPAAVPDADRQIVERLPAGVPRLLLVNKIDLLADKARLLPWLAAYDALGFDAVIPISARSGDGVARVLDEIAARLPEGEAGYPADTLTDRPSRFFASEYVREQVLAATHGEVPHAVAVSIDRYEEGASVRIQATIHVEKPGQRKILVGAGGSMIRRIGIAARERIGRLLGGKVELFLFVRISPRWRDAPHLLAELGYASPEGTPGAESPKREER